MQVALASSIIAANVLGALMVFPQVVRLHRTRRPEGISAVWAGIGVATNAWWVVYGLGAGVWTVLPVSTISTVAYLTMAVLLGRLRPEDRRLSLSGFAAIGVVPVAFLAGGGWPAAGLVVGLLYGVQLVPAVVGAYRVALPVGISPGTWTLGWIEAFLWAFYGFGVGDIALVAAGLTGLTMASAILVRLAFVRRSRLVPTH